jgi:hypothetical protein
MNRRTVIITVLAVVTLWLSSFFVLGALFATPTERGQVGDLFGAVNALFSGLAFAGLIIAITLQRQELAIQREELRLQRDEMAKSREQLANQVVVQRALVLATIAQVRVAAKNAEIEAIKLEAESRASHARGEQIKQIGWNVDQLSALADKLEQSLEGQFS